MRDRRERKQAVQKAQIIVSKQSHLLSVTRLVRKIAVIILALNKNIEQNSTVNTVHV